MKSSLLSILFCSLLSVVVVFASFKQHRETGGAVKIKQGLSKSGTRRIAQKLPNLSTEFPKPVDVYDLIVIGSGPGGESAAVSAAQLGARVAVIERRAKFGGASGLSSKAIREATKRIVKAIDAIGGDRRRQVQSLWKRRFPAVKTEAEVFQVAETRDRLSRNGIDLFIGQTNFINSGQIGLDLYDDLLENESEHVEKTDNATKDSTTVRVCAPAKFVDLKARHVIIATGSRPNRPQNIRQHSSSSNILPVLPWKRGTVVCATEMGSLPRVPRAAAILGGGVIAVEYATILAALGVGVSLICPDSTFLPFLDSEIRESLKRRMKKEHILFVDEPVKQIIVEEGASKDSSDIVRVFLEPRILKKEGHKVRQLPERVLSVDLVLYSGGRDANSEGLGLENVAIEVGNYGRIEVDSSFETTSKNIGLSIFAVGDVIGGGLASTATQQARNVATKLFGKKEVEIKEFVEDSNDVDKSEIEDFFNTQENDHHDDDAPLFGNLCGSAEFDTPLTLWTYPEIASVGYTEVQAMDKFNGAIICGRAFFKDIARGRLSGDLDGFLKIIAHTKSKEIVGVHIIGEYGNELIMPASLLLHNKATLDQVSKTPFAAVTLSALFGIAAEDAILKLREKERERN